jgi:hypothetical protein
MQTTWPADFAVLVAVGACQTALTDKRRTEQQLLLCVAARKVESKLLQWRSQVCLVRLHRTAAPV